MATISPPFNLDMFGILLGIWIAQLGVSSGAYFVLIKSERKIELPIMLLLLWLFEKVLYKSQEDTENENSNNTD